MEFFRRKKKSWFFYSVFSLLRTFTVPNDRFLKRTGSWEFEPKVGTFKTNLLEVFFKFKLYENLEERLGYPMVYIET